MQQLVQLETLKEEFKQRGIIVMGVSMEAKDMSQHAPTLKRLGDRNVHLGAAFQGVGMEKYAPTSGYLIDKKGVVRQVFPMETYNRPPSWSILNEIDRLFSK